MSVSASIPNYFLFIQCLLQAEVGPTFGMPPGHNSVGVRPTSHLIWFHVGWLLILKCIASFKSHLHSEAYGGQRWVRLMSFVFVCVWVSAQMWLTWHARHHASREWWEFLKTVISLTHYPFSYRVCKVQFWLGSCWLSEVVLASWQTWDCFTASYGLLFILT